jgi:hypothetical protein
MEHGHLDALSILVTAVVSFFVTIAIVYLMDFVRPGLITSKAGTSVFVYIGVFSANLIIESLHDRLEKRRDR